MKLQMRLQEFFLTSLPMRSFLFSMTPQGAIPIVQIFFDDLEQCSLRALPTCFATPVVRIKDTYDKEHAIKLS